MANFLVLFFLAILQKIHALLHILIFPSVTDRFLVIFFLMLLIITFLDAISWHLMIAVVPHIIDGILCLSFSTLKFVWDPSIIKLVLGFAWCAIPVDKFADNECPWIVVMLFQFALSSWQYRQFKLLCLNGYCRIYSLRKSVKTCIELIQSGMELIFPRLILVCRNNMLGIMSSRLFR